jgi:hypothetical protein
MLRGFRAGDRDAPSCFETHRSAAVLAEFAAFIARCDAPQHEGREIVQFSAGTLT